MTSFEHVSSSDASLLEHLRNEEPDYQMLIEEPATTRAALHRLLEQERHLIEEDEELASRVLYVLSAVDPEGALPELVRASTSTSGTIKAAAANGLASVTVALRKQSGLVEPLAMAEVLGLVSNHSAPGRAMRQLATLVMHDMDDDIRMAGLNALSRSVERINDSPTVVGDYSTVMASIIDGRVVAEPCRSLAEQRDHAQDLAKHIDDTPA
ncbi:hypothetical protein AB0N88_23975 [Streptomyces sp. NPDC093516]|uniref:hypothetical protein n=1 Tax=Streptomyces sp. NPDC093516 TaxID=3155304 RepID=UPI0034277061